MRRVQMVGVSAVTGQVRYVRGSGRLAVGKPSARPVATKLRAAIRRRAGVRGCGKQRTKGAQVLYNVRFWYKDGRHPKIKCFNSASQKHNQA